MGVRSKIHLPHIFPILKYNNSIVHSTLNHRNSKFFGMNHSFPNQQESVTQDVDSLETVLPHNGPRPKMWQFVSYKTVTVLLITLGSLTVSCQGMTPGEKCLA